MVGSKFNICCSAYPLALELVKKKFLLKIGQGLCKTILYVNATLKVQSIIFLQTTTEERGGLHRLGFLCVAPTRWCSAVCVEE